MKQKQRIKDGEEKEQIKELEELKIIIKKIKEKYSINIIKQIEEISKEAEIEEIPLRIFSNNPPLTSLVKYLKEKGLTTKEIAEKLNRDYKTIYQAQKKRAKHKDESNNNNFEETGTDEKIPIIILADRKFSIMESVVRYLHEEKNMKFSTIAKITRKDPRTIWTNWNRARKKESMKT